MLRINEYYRASICVILSLNAGGVVVASTSSSVAGSIVKLVIPLAGKSCENGLTPGVECVTVA